MTPQEARLLHVLSDGQRHVADDLAALFDLSTHRIRDFVYGLRQNGRCIIGAGNDKGNAKSYRLLPLPIDRKEEYRRLTRKGEFSHDEAVAIILDDIAVQERRKARAA